MAEFVKKLSKEVVGEHEFELLKLLIKFRGLDLEAILGELDTIISFSYAEKLSGNYLLSGTRFPFDMPRVRAFALRHKIKHEIIKEYRSVDTNKVVELYSPIFDSLFSQIDSSKDVLNVFTTNYDPSIEAFCRSKYKEYSLCDGFQYIEADREHVWRRDVFDNYQIVPGKRNIVLFKLHGSVDWIENKDSGNICRGQAMFDAMDSDAYTNTLIYPATRKIATTEPFYSAYDYYQRCCESARACMAIGYSFRDYDALMRLRGARSVNEEFRLVLLAPDADKILEMVPLADEKKIALNFKFAADSHSNYMPAFRDVAGFDPNLIKSKEEVASSEKPDLDPALYPAPNPLGSN